MMRSTTITSCILLLLATLPSFQAFLSGNRGGAVRAWLLPSQERGSLHLAPGQHHTATDDSSHDRRQWITNLARGISSVAVSIAAFPAVVTAAADKAPGEPYTVRMQVQTSPSTSSAIDTIEIEVIPAWAPLAAARFRELIDARFFDDSRFYRVLPNYVAQFGLSSSRTLNEEWLYCAQNCRALPDEPRLQSNTAGTLSFATAGGAKNSRQTQIFINLANNGGVPNFLDVQGFVPFARVTKGFDTVVKQLNAEYGRKESLSGGLAGSVNQGKAAYFGNEYLDTVFPNLSVIQSVRIL